MVEPEKYAGISGMTSFNPVNAILQHKPLKKSQKKKKKNLKYCISLRLEN